MESILSRALLTFGGEEMERLNKLEERLDTGKLGDFRQRIEHVGRWTGRS